MKYLEKYGKRVLWTIISITISISILTALYYFNIIGANIYNYLKIIIVLFNIFIQSYILGKQSEKHGYLEGLKFSGIMILIFLIISLLTQSRIRPRIILYYFIISMSSILGCIMGISKKDKKN